MSASFDAILSSRNMARSRSESETLEGYRIREWNREQNLACLAADFDPAFEIDFAVGSLCREQRPFASNGHLACFGKTLGL